MTRRATVKSERLEYSLHNKTFQGYAAYDAASKETRPAVLIAHTWMGQTPFIHEKAHALAELGYFAFGVDLFGEGYLPSGPDEARAAIQPLIEERQILRERMAFAVDWVRKHPLVHAKQIGAIGFCFGGTCVLELAKSGADINGVVSFHGVLGNPNHFTINPIPTAPSIPASLLLCHGYKDAMVPEEDLLRFEREMAERGADWQVLTFGNAMHGFTNPTLNRPELSLMYDAKSAARAWRAMRHFLDEVFTLS